MSEKGKLKLRFPTATWDRSKRALGILVLAVLLEQVDPFPFFKSTGAWFLYAWFVFEVAKQFFAYRMEVSYPAVARAESYKRRWTHQKDRVAPLTRYRLRRLVIIIAGALVFGQVVNLFSDRCGNALSCVLLSPSLVVEAMPMIVQVAFGILFGMLQFVAMFWFLAGVGFGEVLQPGTINVTFDDIYGQDKARDRVRELIQLLMDSQTVEGAGGHIPKGALLTGPPGTGKTMLAKAAANLLTLPVIVLPPGAFASTFIGINFLKVGKLGRWIRKNSTRYGGVLVFIDEIDSLGNRGGVEEGNAQPAWYMTDSGKEYWFEPMEPGCTAPSIPDHHPVVVTGGGGGMNMGTLESLLAMIDGMDKPRGFSNKVLSFFGFKPLPPPETKVFYMGATNRPSAVDPALKRAGRLGVEIRVDYPRYEGRIATYKGYLKKVNHMLDENEIAWFARNHHRATGAEIEDVVNEALLASFREAEHPGQISHLNMMNAMLWKRFGESHGTFENDNNRWGVAVHEAGHALIMYKLLRERQHIWFVSIEQRGRTGGMVVPSPQDDDWKQWHDEMLAGVAVSLASRAAELEVLGQMTNGHGGDGPAATKKAESLILNGHYKQFAFEKPMVDSNDRFFQSREEVLKEAFDLATSIIKEDKEALLALANTLLEKPTIAGEEVHRIFEAHGV